MQKRLTLTASSTLAFFAGGCDAGSEKALLDEFQREMYTRDLGPVVLASIVFASVPAGAPSALSALCTDRAWGMAAASFTTDPDSPETTYVPSMFETPDPTRRIIITRAPVVE